MGDLILRRAEISKPTEHDKLALNWKKSYRIADVIHLGAYKIKNLNESVIFHT